jgi:hypothetical protein
LFYLPMSRNLFPFNNIFTFGNRKNHTEPYLANRGVAALVGSDVSPRSSGQGGTSGRRHCRGAGANHLASMTQVACATPHHAANKQLQHSTPC